MKSKNHFIHLEERDAETWKRIHVSITILNKFFFLLNYHRTPFEMELWRVFFRKKKFE